MQRGGADKILINTSGVGVIKSSVRISASRAPVGDKVILNGPIYVANEGKLLAVGAAEIADASSPA